MASDEIPPWIEERVLAILEEFDDPRDQSDALLRLLLGNPEQAPAVVRWLAPLRESLWAGSGEGPPQGGGPSGAP